jgi:hypothetical protein
LNKEQNLKKKKNTFECKRDRKRLTELTLDLQSTMATSSTSIGIFQPVEGFPSLSHDKQTEG